MRLSLGVAQGRQGFAHPAKRLRDLPQFHLNRQPSHTWRLEGEMYRSQPARVRQRCEEKRGLYSGKGSIAYSTLSDPTRVSTSTTPDSSELPQFTDESQLLRVDRDFARTPNLHSRRHNHKPARRASHSPPPPSTPHTTHSKPAQDQLLVEADV